MTRPVTEEPTHKDEDGNTRPGPADLRSTVTADKVEEVDAVMAEHYKDADNRNRASAMNPSIASPYSPLQNLAWDALREYGEMNPGTMDGDTMLMFLRFANYIVEDLRAHPYWDIPDIDYYTSLTDKRQIPDTIMIYALQSYYAMQQQSGKMNIKTPAYYRRMNELLYNRKFGNGPIEVTPRK